MLISKFDTINIENIINEFENKYHFQVPSQYKQFLLKYNGGETPKTNFKINRISSDIRGFYGLGSANKFYNYNSLEEIGILNDFLERQFLPIAKNLFGDYILIDISKENNGKVYFQYHDREEKNTELSRDFIEFIEKCKSKKIGHIRSVEERMQGLKDAKSTVEVTDSLKAIWQQEIDKFSNMKQEELVL